MDLIGNLTALLARGQDTALVRFGLGQALLGADRPREAAEHLRQALAHDTHYSAAWKLYGKALAQNGDIEGAIRAYETGIRIAEERGDKQAAREMQVFLKRLQG